MPADAAHRYPKRAKGADAAAPTPFVSPWIPNPARLAAPHGSGSVPPRALYGARRMREAAYSAASRMMPTSLSTGQEP